MPLTDVAIRALKAKPLKQKISDSEGLQIWFCRPERRYGAMPIAMMVRRNRWPLANTPLLGLRKPASGETKQKPN